MQNLKLDKVTAIASVIIAFGSVISAWAAISISVREGKATRKHHRLSTMPQLTLSLEARPNVTMGIFVTNEGLGPAIIGDVVLTVGEANYDGNTAEGWNGALNRPEIDRIPVDRHAMTEGTYIQAGKTLFLVQADKDKISEEQGSRFIQAISKLKVRIEYGSVYGEKSVAEGDWTAFLNQP